MGRIRNRVHTGNITHLVVVEYRFAAFVAGHVGNISVLRVVIFIQVVGS